MFRSCTRRTGKSYGFGTFPHLAACTTTTSEAYISTHLINSTPPGGWRGRGVIHCRTIDFWLIFKPFLSPNICFPHFVFLAEQRLRNREIVKQLSSLNITKCVEYFHELPKFCLLLYPTDIAGHC
jgi:hypothetical protein